MGSSSIHIAYALDDGFAEMTCVSIVSLLRNTAEQVEFHIIESRLSNVHIEKIKNLVDSYSHGVCKFYHVDIDGNVYSTTKESKVTKETYACGMLPVILCELDRVIWLDGDTIIEEDIAQIWDVDLGEYYAAMVPDTSWAPKEPKKAVLGIEAADWYFNSGVMLLDLAMLRRFKLTELLEIHLEATHKSVLDAGLEWYRVQDMLNYLLKGRIKRLPLRFNSYFWISQLLDENIDECVDAYLTPSIVHFIGTPKPTELAKIPVNLPEWERYYKYKALSPYADLGDAEKTAAYRMRERNTLDSLMPYFDENLIHWYSFPFAKQMFELSAERYRLTANGKKIVVWGLNNRTWTLAVYLAAHGLDVKGIVDGLESNLGIRVFDYTVEPPEILRETVGDTFVMLDMRNYDIARQIMAELRSWGYSEDDFCYVYAPIWDGTGVFGEITATSTSR